MAENVTTSITFTKWELISPAAMAACLDDLVRMGYWGSVQGYRDQYGATVWDMNVNSSDNPANAIKTEMGNVIVLLSDHLVAMTPEQYAERYGT